jgi:NADH:ubiquinone oxidoreductase subunit 4 (subunit M)
MNNTHIHLLLNHFPVIGTLIGSGVLLWGIIKKQNNIKSAGAAILALMAVIAVPVYLTGEPAEEAVEKLPGVSETMMEMHEQAAGIAIWLMGITGLASLLAMFFAWQQKKGSNTAFVIAFILSAACFGAMARTGYYGGQIRHTEIRGAGTADTQGEKGAEKDAEKDDD